MDNLIKPPLKLMSEHTEPYSLDGQIAYMEYCVKELKLEQSASTTAKERDSFNDVLRMHNGILENLYALRIFAMKMADGVDLQKHYELEKQHG